MTNMAFFTTGRIAGVLLLLSLLLILGGAGLIAAQGRLGGMAAAFRSVGLETGDASGLRTIAGFAIPYTMAQLAGYALFALLLHQAGDRGTAVVVLTLFVFSAVYAAIEGSFHARVTVWAAEEASRTGSAPEFYDPLRLWANGVVQLVYMSFLLTALLLFSVSALRAGLFSPGLGWAALALSLPSFPIYFLVLGAPLVVILTPLLFGVGLLLRG